MDAKWGYGKLINIYNVNIHSCYIYVILLIFLFENANLDCCVSGWPRQIFVVHDGTTLVTLLMATINL